MAHAPRASAPKLCDKMLDLGGTLWMQPKNSLAAILHCPLVVLKAIQADTVVPRPKVVRFPGRKLQRAID